MTSSTGVRAGTTRGVRRNVLHRKRRSIVLFGRWACDCHFGVSPLVSFQQAKRTTHKGGSLMKESPEIIHVCTKGAVASDFDSGIIFGSPSPKMPPARLHTFVSTLPGRPWRLEAAQAGFVVLFMATQRGKGDGTIF